MDREFLEKMGIEKDNIDKILNKFHEGIKDYKDNAEKANNLEAENNSLKTQLNQRDKDLAELKKVDVNELQSKITELETKNKNLKESSEKELLSTKMNFAIDKSLINSKAKNLKAIKGLLDMDKITYENGELKGLDDQLKSIKDSDGYLFDIQDSNQTVNLGGDHKSIDTPDLSAMSYDEYKAYRNKTK